MDRRSVLRDAVVAGVIGATSVALWFLVLDLIAGQPFETPAALGRSLIGVLGPAGSEGMAVHVIVYTLFHYAAFFVVALVASLIVHLGEERQPGLLAGAMILFVAFEIGFTVLASILTYYSGFQGNHSWVAVAVGNLIAALAMGVYLWRRHPALGRRLSAALQGEDDVPMRRPAGR